MSPIIRWLASSIIGIGSAVLLLGVLLYQAAFVTGAAADYTISVSWSSALMSTLWPPWRLPYLLLLGVVVAVAATAFLFFRVGRGLGIPLLLVEAGTFYWFGGWLGWHFLPREFTYWSFSMDGEKLGEYWFGYESLAVWSAAVALLAVLRLLHRGHTSDATKATQRTAGRSAF